jgi:hypothetical protein
LCGASGAGRGRERASGVSVVSGLSRWVVGGGRRAGILAVASDCFDGRSR